MSNNIDLLKKEIYQVFNENNAEIEKIILFGSRAKGNYKKDSDWDILIITAKDYDFEYKRKIRSLLRRRLAEMRIDADLIIKSKKYIESDVNVGVVSYYALKEGITI